MATLSAASATLKVYQRTSADAHVDEVDHVAEPDAVDQVADGPAEQEPEGDGQTRGADAAAACLGVDEDGRSRPGWPRRGRARSRRRGRRDRRRCRTWRCARRRRAPASGRPATEAPRAARPGQAGTRAIQPTKLRELIDARASPPRPAPAEEPAKRRPATLTTPRTERYADPAAGKLDVRRRGRWPAPVRAADAPPPASPRPATRDGVRARPRALRHVEPEADPIVQRQLGGLAQLLDGALELARVALGAQLIGELGVDDHDEALVVRHRGAGSRRGLDLDLVGEPASRRPAARRRRAGTRPRPPGPPP